MSTSEPSPSLDPEQDPISNTIPVIVISDLPVPPVEEIKRPSASGLQNVAQQDDSQLFGLLIDAPEIEWDVAGFTVHGQQRRPRTTSVMGDASEIEGEGTSYLQKPLILEREHNRGRYMNPEYELPEDEYPKPSVEPGEVLIFNFETFNKSPPRYGTRLDVKELIKTFGCLKYNISQQCIFNDLTKAELFSAINTKISLLEEGNVNCLIVFFLTHGESQNVIETKDVSIHVEDVVHAFQCEALKGVPQWYTFLACKASEDDDGNVFTNDDDDADDDNVPKKQTVMKLVSDTTFSKRLPDDVLIYYSTTEGNASARYYEQGTWLIQELCHVLNGYGRREEIMGILTRTNKCVANNYVHEDHRQVPVIITTLAKKLYLTLAKERINQLKVYNVIKELQKVYEDNQNQE